MNEQIQLLIELLLQNKVDISLDMLRNKDFMNNLIDIINLYLNRFQDKKFTNVKLDTNIEEVKHNAINVMDKIIRKELLKDIYKLIEDIQVTNKEDFNASIRLRRDSHNNFVVSEIQISDISSIIAIPAIAHECGHAITLENSLSRFKNEHFEMFSILIDKITSYELEVCNKKYYGIQDVNNAYRRIDFCKKAKSFINSSKRDIPENNKYIIQLLTSQIIIGEIYATLLFEKYLEDKELFIYLMDLVFDSTMSVDEFLLYYGIGINKNTYDQLSLLLS